MLLLYADTHGRVCANRNFSPSGSFRAYTFWTLSEARSRLYQRRFLRSRAHFSAFFKLYIFSFAPFQNFVIFQNLCTMFFLKNEIKVDQITVNLTVTRRGDLLRRTRKRLSCFTPSALFSARGTRRCPLGFKRAVQELKL